MVYFTIDTISNGLMEFEESGTVFIVGPNGSGKSSLLAQIYDQIGAGKAAALFAGHRQITTSNDNFDSMQQPLDQLENNLYSQKYTSRYRGHWGEDLYKAGIKRLTNEINDYNASYYRAKEDGDADAIAEMSKRGSRLNALNRILELANLAVRLRAEGGYLRVIRGTAKYNIDKMSDGERAIMSVLAELLSRKSGDRVLIDEPERHLHPSICGPLWQAAVDARPDIQFFFCTHQLDLIDWVKPKLLIQVVDSTVRHVEPEIRAYDVHVLDPEVQLHDELRESILGSRKNILFVEGDRTDRRLFQVLYPNYLVKDAGGWEAVVNWTKTLQNNSSLTWIHARGIIDGDGRSTAEKNANSLIGIYTLRFASIENLLFNYPVISIIANHLYAALGGLSANDRLAAAKSAIEQRIAHHQQDIVARRTVWAATIAMTDRKISVSQVRDGTARIPEIDVGALKAQIEAELAPLFLMPPFEALAVLPIKETGIPSAVSKALGLSGEAEYVDMIIHQISLASKTGINLRNALLWLLEGVDL